VRVWGGGINGVDLVDKRMREDLLEEASQGEGVRVLGIASYNDRRLERRFVEGL